MGTDIGASDHTSNYDHTTRDEVGTLYSISAKIIVSHFGDTSTIL